MNANRSEPGHAAGKLRNCGSTTRLDGIEVSEDVLIISRVAPGTVTHGVNRGCNAMAMTRIISKDGELGIRPVPGHAAHRH